MPEQNFVSTNATDTIGAKGLVQQPYLATATPGYNYGGAGNPTGDGFMEFGAGTPGALPFRVDQAGNVTANSFLTGAPGSGSPTLGLLAATAVAGYTLVNGTGSIISWTAPNDGALHRVSLAATLSVTVTEVGGAINLNITAPDGTSTTTLTVDNGAHGTGVHAITDNAFVIVEAGSTVTLAQHSALTGGAAVLWAELWGS